MHLVTLLAQDTAEVVGSAATTQAGSVPTSSASTPSRRFAREGHLLDLQSDPAGPAQTLRLGITGGAQDPRGSSTCRPQMPGPSTPRSSFARALPVALMRPPERAQGAYP
jgi:hypothetical protein